MFDAETGTAGRTTARAAAVKSVGVALVGTGFMARTHLEAYQRLPQANVLHVVGTSGEKAAVLAGEVGAQATASLAAALADPKVELVDLTVPTPHHADLAVQALEAGKHVIVEKPMALDLAGADRMLAASAANGRELFVAQVVRFWPEYVRIGELLEEDAFGPPYAVRTYRLSSPPGWAAWLADPAQTGGAAVDLGIHDLDILNRYFGRPRSVQAWGHPGPAGGWGSYSAHIEYRGVAATTEASMTMPDGYPFTAGIEIRCERGVIEYRFRAGGASFEEGEPENQLLLFPEGGPPERLRVEQTDPFESQLAEFLTCAAGDRPSRVVGPEGARLALELALGVNKSLDLGRAVEFPEARGARVQE